MVPGISCSSTVVYKRAMIRVIGKVENILKKIHECFDLCVDSG